MAAKKVRIVLLKEGADVEHFAKNNVKDAECVDCVTKMATDYMPKPNTVQMDQELGFYVAEYTDDEVKKVKGESDVDEVEDDIEVFALSHPEFSSEASDSLDTDESFLQLEQQDIDELNQDPFPEYGPEENPFSDSEIDLAAQIVPDGFEDLELNDFGQPIQLGMGAFAQSSLAGLPKEKIWKLLNCLFKCAFAELAPGKEISDERVAEALRVAGLTGEVGEGALAATQDHITRGLRQIYAPQAWRRSTGAGTRVAVVDTGIASGHPDLRVYGGASFVPGVTSWNDDAGHGTHVAGTIAAPLNRLGVAGVAPHARLYAVKVLNRNGSGQLSWILNGLAWCYRHRMHIANLSLGSRERNHDPRVFNRSYEQIGGMLRRRGILLVAAAGNRPEAVGNPARCPSYMAVSAIDFQRRRATFSCFGRQVEVCAPGVSILSTYPPSGYRSMNGTSMASPHTAGVAALVKARFPGWHGDKIRVHLWRTALDLGRRGRDPFFGYGQISAFHAVR